MCQDEVCWEIIKHAGKLWCMLGDCEICWEPVKHAWKLSLVTTVPYMTPELIFRERGGKKKQPKTRNSFIKLWILEFMPRIDVNLTSGEAGENSNGVNKSFLYLKFLLNVLRFPWREVRVLSPQLLNLHQHLALFSCYWEEMGACP